MLLKHVEICWSIGNKTEVECGAAEMELELLQHDQGFFSSDRLLFHAVTVQILSKQLV